MSKYGKPSVHAAETSSGGQANTRPSAPRPKPEPWKQEHAATPTRRTGSGAGRGIMITDGITEGGD